MTDIVQVPYLQVLRNGTPIPDVYSVSTSHGYSQAIAEAHVRVPHIDAIVPWDVIEIRVGLGADADEAEANAATRFKGLYVQTTRDLYPTALDLVCKGYLVKGQIYRLSSHAGLDLTGSAGDHHGETDQGYIYVLFKLCGLTPDVAIDTSGDIVVAASGDYPALDLKGTGILMGGNQPTDQGYGAHGAFLMRYGETSFDWIQRIDAISLGYRTFDSIDGKIARYLISAIPSGAPDFEFIEGVDIERATLSDTFLDAKDYVAVAGYADGVSESDSAHVHHQHYEARGFNPYFYYGESGTFGVVPVALSITSPMLERSVASDPGQGITCQQVAEWLLAENNVRRLSVPLITPRGDAIKPGDTIRIHSPYMLGLTSHLFWVQDVALQLDETGRFQQTLTGIGVA